VSYTEDRSALRWPVIFWGLGLPLLLMLVTALLGVTVDAQWFILTVAVPLFFMIPISLLYRNWRTGIRIDAEGIRTGAVRGGHPNERRYTVTHQTFAVFSCPWPGIDKLTVVTDPVEIRRIRRSPDYLTLSNRWAKPRGAGQCMLGVLTAPFMRSALLIEVDPFQTNVPDFRSATFFPNKLDQPLTTRLRPSAGTVWVVPTRHPDRLRRALTAAQGR
jgi:hypothetical protein